MITEQLHVDMFFQITTGFSANVNSFPSPQNTLCTFTDKFAACTITPGGKFSLLLKIFIVKIKAKLVLNKFVCHL